MKKTFFILIFLSFFLHLVTINAISNSNDSLVWKNTWSEEIFKQAKNEDKFILLDLEAIWCHWCHVMKEETYSDLGVQKIIKDKFIPVRIDQDSRPDLANKYRRYAWPATIVFNSDGVELIKRRGYIPPDQIKEELNNIVHNPVPEEPDIDLSKIIVSSKPVLEEEVRSKLIKGHKSSFDPQFGGFKAFQKYLDRDTVEYSLVNSMQSDEARMAKLTLNNAIKLIDPAWGGVYQYSTMGGWDYPHFEKLASLQGEYLRIYSLAYSTFRDSKYLMAATDIHRYITGFLQDPSGAFYTSQDADLVQGEYSREYFALNSSERIRKGIPKVDKNIYSSNNGLIITGLVELYNATSDETYLNEAIDAANWIIRNRKTGTNIFSILGWVFDDVFDFQLIAHRISWVVSNLALPGIGYRHDKKDLAGPFLCDTLYMGNAFLALYKTTLDKKWLIKAEQAMQFINRYFSAPLAGFATAASSCEICAVSGTTIRTDENIGLVRFASGLYGCTKNESYKENAEHGLKYLVVSQVALRSTTEPGILIAEKEFVKSVLGLS